MKCFNHTNIDAVATCVDCGKSLCKTCASKYEPILCDDCYQERMNKYNAGQQEYKGSIVGSIIWSVILFIAGFVIPIIMYGEFDAASSFGMGYCLAGFPYGWRALNRITPDIFLIMPIVGWLIYFIIKAFLAVMIGWIAMPIQIIRKIAEIRRIG